MGLRSLCRLEQVGFILHSINHTKVVRENTIIFVFWAHHPGCKIADGHGGVEDGKLGGRETILVSMLL